MLLLLPAKNKLRGIAMSEALDDIWGSVLQQLRKQLSTQSYDTWFAPTKQISSAGGRVSVEVPNQFFKDWLIEHYNDQIQQALCGVHKNNTALEFIVSNRVGPDTPAQEGVGEKRSGFRLFQNPFERINPSHDSSFNQRYTFDSFVVGSCNRFAHAAAMAVADSPAKAYNPLFIYGGVGLGKTHLMQAMGQHALQKYPRLRITYMSSEKFTNQLISAIQNRTTQKFKERYRQQDVLLIDDIQFISGKESTQEEFFHTFNTLYDAHKQIVVSSDRPPKEIPALEKRLVSRFEWGLVTDIQPPDTETRVAILRKKLEASAVQVSDDVLFCIAETIKTNIRELEGALIRVIAYASLVGRVVDAQAVKEVLRDVETRRSEEINVEKVQNIVAQYFGLSRSNMRAKKRTQKIAYPRQIAMYLTRELTKAPLAEIGGMFGGRDHTTVMHACNKIEKDLDNNPQLQQTINEIITQLKI
jgi:chromosomal replication initiator protein